MEADSQMEADSHSCRICRGEATFTQPLLHPCKCRGSIKYVHQDCLLEWLNHSNKSTEKCDICNTPYTFKIIYDPSMPSRIPLFLIWQKLLQTISRTFVTSLSLSLYVLCVIIQVPFYWKFAGRVYTWALDGKLPFNNQSIKEALFFGEFDIETFLSNYIGSNGTNITPFQLEFITLRKFFGYTYFSGLRYLVIAIIVHIALFVEHEWVVRDEGYSKLLLRKIGKEPRTKLLDMLQQALTGLRNDQVGNPDAAANLRRLETLANAINDLQNENHNEEPNRVLRQDVLRAIIDTGEAFNDDNNNNQNNNHNNLHNHNQNTNDTLNHNNDHIHNNDNHTNNPHHDDHNDDLSDGEVADNDERRTVFVNGGVRNPNEGEAPRPGPEDTNPQLPPPPRYNADIAGELAELINEEAAGVDNDDAEDDLDDEIEAEAEAVAEAAANGAGGVENFLELFGVSLNIKTPIFLMFVCDFVISAYLFVVYLIPHMLGNIFVSIVGSTIQLVNATIIRPFIADPKLISIDVSGINTGVEFFDFALISIQKYIITPSLSTFHNLFVEMKNPQYSLVERTMFLLFGYAIVAITIYKLMQTVVAGTKPVVGTPRRIYKKLFELTSTLKVFLIFAIEIFFFPVYCGWLLDFCAAPLVLPQFTRQMDDGSTTFIILVTSYFETLQVSYIRVLLYWGCGTLYMLFFALFIGMVRSTILRPGVLFFIRSPDDPNARLIHDALVKPLMLQLSRIYLSAKVYTGFILIGIGGVTWGCRYLLKSSSDGYYLLPIEAPTILADIIFFYTVSRIIASQPLISKYCQQYWVRAFEISCHKLRLSHFILGKPISQERGYIVYRNIFHQLLATAQPDYSRPVAYYEAIKLFKQDPTCHAYFVPNGNYVRAPENDGVSRKFIKKLFVTVTKDDQLLTAVEQNNTRSGYETPSSEEEEEDINTENAYTVVYRPPSFKARCFGLICMLWVFAVLFILILIFIAMVLGLPFMKINQLIMEFSSSSTSFKLDFNPLSYKFELASLAIGFRLELAILSYFDKYLATRQFGSGGNEAIGNNGADLNADARLGENVNVADDAQIEPRNELFNRFIDFIREINFLPNVPPILIIATSFFLWGYFILTVHKLCVDDPLRYYFNLTRLPYLISGLSVPIHFVVSLWTIFPFLTYVFVSMPHLNGDAVDRANIRQLIWKCGLAPVIMNFTLLHFPAAVVTFYTKFAQDFELGGGNTAIRIYVWPCMCMVFLIVKIVHGSYNLFNDINELVKKEKYVKGRAIANVDGSDDEDEGEEVVREIEIEI